MSLSRDLQGCLETKLPQAGSKRCCNKVEKIFRTTYDFIIELPCVSPFRDNLDIDNALKILINNKKLDSVISYVNTGENILLDLKE